MQTQRQIDDKIEEWHLGAATGIPLHEYLGWTEEQYKDFLEKGIKPDVA